MKPNFDFKKIEVGPRMMEHLLYKRVKAARNGHLPRDIALRKSGKIVHSRWVTTAETFVEFWQSDHWT